MRITRALFLALVACASSTLGVATSAHAGPLNLRWGKCWGDGGTMNRSFACDTNVGNQVLVGSFFMPAARSNVNGNEITLNIAVAGGSLPPWWQLVNAGSCRSTGLGFSPNPPVDATNCVDWADYQGAGGIASYAVDFLGPGTARLRIAKAVAAPVPLTTGVEYFSFLLVLSNAKSVGSGACAGCSLGACLALAHIKVVTTSILDDVVIAPALGSIGSDDRLATWQGGVGVVTQGPAALNCPLATPARNTSWGAVKALYR